MTYKRAQTGITEEGEANLLIGQRLNSVRRKLNLSQAEAANRLGVALRTYQNYEQGEREISARALVAAAMEFGIDPMWMYCGPGLEPKRDESKFDEELMRRAMAAVRDYLRDHRIRKTPEEVDGLTVTFYRYCKLKGEIDAGFLKTMTQEAFA